ncbi:hypothetical protein [Gynuella sp.]|uniref:hypothetical protein n=1 Tax=Gynuella sp. TaxID=2969146 RepID=UPI003D12C3C4
MLYAAQPEHYRVPMFQVTAGIVCQHNNAAKRYSVFVAMTAKTAKFSKDRQ